MTKEELKVERARRQELAEAVLRLEEQKNSLRDNVRKEQVRPGRVHG